MDDDAEARSDAGSEAADLRYVEGFEVVRKRPRSYFGVALDGPDLPLQVMLSAVHDALWEVHVGPVLNVRVTVESDRVFRVEDDGPGLPTHSTDPDGTPMVVRLFRDLLTGMCPPRGVGLVIPTAMCSRVTASVRREGRLYRVDSGFRRETRLTDLGSTEGHGTSMRFVLDEDHFPHDAALPRDPAPAIEAAIDPPMWNGRTKVRGRVDVCVEDLRTGSRVLRTVLPNGTGRCAICRFDCDDPLAENGA